MPIHFITSMQCNLNKELTQISSWEIFSSGQSILSLTPKRLCGYTDPHLSFEDPFRASTPEKILLFSPILLPSPKPF